MFFHGIFLFTVAVVADVHSGGTDLPSTNQMMIPRDPVFGNDTVVVQIGDELLTTAEYEELFRDDGTRVVTKRKAAKSALLRWTNAVVPYEITSDFTEDEKKVVHQAMDLFEKTTCLKFRKATESDKNKIVIHNGSGGCVSMLGMIGGSQNVDLSSDGCHFFGLYLHEIGHALGLIHEQQRPDRQKYVRVLWRNVQYRLYRAYKKEPAMTTETFGIPYDLSSIMQYEVSAFANDNEQTLFPLKNWQREWPARVFWKTMSMTDVMSLNKMYKCSERCTDATKKAAATKKCEAIKWKNAIIDKDCNCVTPNDHYKTVCQNLSDNKACYERARKGDCQTDSGYMNVNCRKACGSCPLFGTKMAKLMYKKYRAKCSNKYWSNKLCKKWADAGECKKYPWWMKRYCAKACKACKEKLGQCLNLGWGSFDNKRCDEVAERGECTDEQNKIQCGDSCKTCGFGPQGDCKNIKPDEECERRAAKNECDMMKTGPDMMANCAKTCNSCWFNNGKCENKLDDKKCEMAATVGKCLSEPKVFRVKCPKTCDSCGYGDQGKCENVWDEHICKNAFENMDCENEGGYYKVMCAKTCNSCKIAAGEAPCANLGASDDACDGWAAREECAANAAYMTVNCAKSCKMCHKLNAKNCYNHHIDFHCDVMIKNDGGCNGYSKQMCRKACKLCTAPEGDNKSECKDHHSSCKKWADAGECDANPVWMKGVCSFSCSQCDRKPTLIDTSDYDVPAGDDYGGDY